MDCLKNPVMLKRDGVAKLSSQRVAQLARRIDQLMCAMGKDEEVWRSLKIPEDTIGCCSAVQDSVASALNIMRDIMTALG